MPLSGAADKSGAAVVGVMHLTKDAQQKAIYRAPGSIAFVGAARAAFLVAKDHDDDARRLLVPVKFNIGPMPPSLAFRIVDDRVVWEDQPLTLDADAVLSQTAQSSDAGRGDRDVAKAFLLELLAAGPMLANDVAQAAEVNRISERTLNRAKQELGIESTSSRRSGSEPVGMVAAEGRQGCHQGCHRMSVATLAEVPDQEGKNSKVAKGAKGTGNVVVRELLTVSEFAGALGVTDAAVRKWLYQGRLERVKLGRAVRLRRRDLDRLVAEGLDAKKRVN